MPRFIKKTILFAGIFGTIIFYTSTVRANGVTFVDTTKSEQTISLLSDQVSIRFSVGSLTKPSRVGFWIDDSVINSNEQLSPVYAWQILDAEINSKVFLELPVPSIETSWQVHFSPDGKSFLPTAYELAAEKIIIPLPDVSGRIYLSSLVLSDFSIYLDAETVTKGYPVKTPDDYFSFYILPDALLQPTNITIKPLNLAAFNIPAGLELVSPIFYFYIDAANNAFPQKDLPIDIKYFGDNINTKDIYYWDNVNKIWLPSPSITRYLEGVVRTHTHQREMILAIFSNGIMEKGVASWYRYKNGDFAASPDYPKGTKLKVTNLANSKSVIVTVNDFGPDRSIHPDRVIDLDRVAFAKIADPSAGVAVVAVEENYY